MKRAKYELETRVLDTVKQRNVALTSTQVSRILKISRQAASEILGRLFHGRRLTRARDLTYVGHGIQYLYMPRARSKATQRPLEVESASILLPAMQLSRTGAIRLRTELDRQLRSA